MIHLSENFNQPIVMVDDDLEHMEIAKRCYKKSKLEYPFVTVTGGTEFVQYMNAVEDGKHPQPALVLLDINMPIMNGFEVLKDVRRRQKFQDVPLIVMFSVSQSPQDKEKAMQAGANGYKVKPFDIVAYVEFFNSLASDATLTLDLPK